MKHMIKRSPIPAVKKRTEGSPPNLHRPGLTTAYGLRRAKVGFWAALSPLAKGIQNVMHIFYDDAFIPKINFITTLICLFNETYD